MRYSFAPSSPTQNVVRTFRETGYGNGMPIAGLMAARGRRPDGQAEEKETGFGRSWRRPGLALWSRAGETPGRARERRPAPLPRRQATAALKAADLAARRPAGPKGKHPNPPTKAGKGCIKARPSGRTASFFVDPLKLSVLFAPSPRTLGASLLEGGFMFGNILLGRCRASGPPRGGRLRSAMGDGWRRCRDRDRRDRVGLRRSERRSSEWIAGAGPSDVSGAGASGVFVSDWRLVVCRRIDLECRHERRKREHGKQQRQHERQRQRL